MTKQYDSSGQSLVEILLAIALAAIIIPGLLTGIVASREGKVQQAQREKASTLLKETEDAVRSVRDTGWATFAIIGTFHPINDGTTWSLSPGAEIIGDFTRSVTIANVQRDGSGAIVQSGGSNDPSTKRLIVDISWTIPHASSIQSEFYLTRYKDNLSYTETTEAQFLLGDALDTAVVNNLDGEIILGSGGGGDWCAPDLTLSTLDLPKSGVANALTAIEGRAFAGTGDNASGVSFANITINNNNPPAAIIADTYDCCKTNAIFGESDYVYLGTDTNNKEIVIVNIASAPYSESGFFDAPGNGDGDSIFVSGSVGYMASGNNFHTFDLTNKSGSRPVLDSIALAGMGNEIIVIGDYAYVAVQNTSPQMQILDVSDPSDISIIGQATVSGQAGMDVFINATGTRAFLATAESSSQNEFFIIDTETKTGNRPTLGSYDSDGMNPKAVTVVSGNRAIIVGTGAEEYQVINVLNEASPSYCGGIEVDSGVNDLASVIESDGDAYTYIITGDTGSELKIIAGGPGGQYSATGTFESATFTPGFQTAYNRIWFTFDQPAQTELTFQLAIENDVAGNCDAVTFNFVGPDKTSGTFFTNNTPIPLDDDGSGYENPGRCVRYKAFFSSSDATQTPVLYDITLNYSP